MDNWNPIAGIVPVLTEETLKNLKQKRADAFYRRDEQEVRRLDKQIAELKELRGEQ
jgi:hypothetical protein